MDARALAELTRLLGEERVLTSPAALRSYDCDAYTVDRSLPQAVVLPETTAEVSEIVRWCNRHEVPFTARGAGTGLSGGALAAKGGLIVSLKRMNRILETDLPNRRLLAQAGVVNRSISQAVEPSGLHFAPDPSSQSVATLGGNIAENSGGPHTLKYGVTVQHILSLTLVDPLGEVHELSAGVPGLPLMELVVGSEGTFGIVTEAWVRLVPLPAGVQTALICFSDVGQATRSVSRIVAEGVIPAALEIMDKGILGALKVAFGLSYVEGTQALLLVECDGEPEAAEREIAQVRNICEEFGALDIQIAGDEKARQKLWAARKKGIGAMGRLAPTIVTHDGVIPRSKLPQMLDFVYQVADERGLGVANLFHAGDGNLHPCFYFDDRDPKQVAEVVAAGEQILRRCIELGGSITGEHGVGVEKLDLMGVMFSGEALDAQRMIHNAFNPGVLCNPCKVMPNQKGCVEHQKRWRGVAW